jgi:hypothetical protein
MADIPPMVERGLRRAFDAVPRKTTTTYDWNSEEGQRFLQHVDQAVNSGISPDRIGEVVGVSNFAARYAAMKRGFHRLF